MVDQFIMQNLLSNLLGVDQLKKCSHKKTSSFLEVYFFYSQAQVLHLRQHSIFIPTTLD